MIVSIWLVVLLCLELCGGQSETGIDKSKRSHAGGHHHHRKKGHFNTPDVKLKYGTDLPSFSFDYSEYFAGAMIERSFDKNELHLTMFLFGHNSISSPVAFESLSTEEDILYSWGQAAKVWLTSHATVRNTTTTVGSGLFCTIHNNDNRHSPYQVPAYWVPMDNTNALHGIHAILRCRIKGALAIYKNETFSSDKRLFVDVSRRLCSKHHPESCLHPLPSLNTTTKSHPTVSSSSSVVMSSDPTSVIISFSVPWRSRYVGYPLQFQLNSTHFDPWDSVNAAATAAIASSSSSSANGQSTHIHKSVTHICVSGLRPLHPHRADVGMPMLLEFIQHHLSMGVSHILIGMLVDWHSPIMYKHLHLLRHFISEGRVSLVSLNGVKKSFEGAPAGTAGIDDVAGVEGVQLRDDFAGAMFLNQCLYFAKGVADNVILMKASDFLVPAALIGSGTDVGDLILRSTTLALMAAPYAGPTTYGLTAARNGRRLEGIGATAADNSEKSGGHLRRAGRPHGGHHHKSHSNDTSSGTSRKHSSSSVASSGASNSSQPHLRIGHRHSRQHSSYNATAAHFKDTGESSGVCSLLVPQYGVADPNSVFASWGPGDDVWTKDYFKLSAKTVQPLLTSVPPAVLILPTRNVISIEVTASGLTVAHCRTHRHNTTSSHGSSAATAHGHHASQVQPLLPSAEVPASMFAAVLYREAFTSSELNIEGGRQKELSGLYAHNLQSLHNSTASRLAGMGLSSISELKRQVKESRSDFNRQMTSGSDSSGAFTIKSREIIKKPFWRQCGSSALLKDVVTQGYFS